LPGEENSTLQRADAERKEAGIIGEGALPQDLRKKDRTVVIMSPNSSGGDAARYEKRKKGANRGGGKCLTLKGRRGEQTFSAKRKRHVGGGGGGGGWGVGGRAEKRAVREGRNDSVYFGNLKGPEKGTLLCRFRCLALVSR